MKTGLVSISFRKLTPEQIVPLCVRCGLDCIEWGSDVHVPVGDLDRAKQVGELTRQAGLEVSCYGSYYRATDAEGAPDAVVATAKALGAKLIRIWAGVLDSADASAEDRAMVVRNTQIIADLAAAENIDITFEFHGKTLTDEAGSALDFLKAVNRPNVFTQWQPPIDMPNDDCIVSLRAVKDYVRNIHVFTWLKGTERSPLEDGAAKWLPLLRDVAALDGEHSLLHEFVCNDDPEQLVTDAACLKKWLKEIV